MNISEHLLAKIKEKYMLSKHTYGSLVNADKKYVPPGTKLSFESCELAVDYTGIGTLDTWHGSPDARLRAFQTHSESVHVINGEASTSDVSSAHSAGDSIVVEAKQDVHKLNIDSNSYCFIFHQTKLAPRIKPINPCNFNIHSGCYDLFV